MVKGFRRKPATHETATVSRQKLRRKGDQLERLAVGTQFSWRRGYSVANPLLDRSEHSTGGSADNSSRHTCREDSAGPPRTLGQILTQ